MTSRETLLAAVADLRTAADLLAGAGDIELLDEVDALIGSAATKVTSLRR